ncbi:non-canonical purine NTP pyrophosphatase, RdgB/HAM1 family [Helicobacter monodelphidis]|uniref:RdgB/HAM1 family non-canonical purine NTP pyrophosphatase n=1 Tax=Helicobacter sp. 15-1451 TaxID=2004995 RepID=UPI000DCCD992|nr:RdgB/HAM1 family non-canonical purine NTP pyrophosphatase [Helicobacter sp. 15-1451]RAX57894.1 non-canonical purine NTP pyrophosphatase, RdgB/HAM1 family [Helicobacter sp. 15-1451]
MKIILASSNVKKAVEIRDILKTFEVVCYSDMIPAFEIVENGKSFQENALIKAKAVYAKIQGIMNESFWVLSDDSGLVVDALGGEPGIFSARYSGEGSDVANLQKVISKLQEKGINESRAYFCAASAIVGEKGDYCVHGFAYGKVITTPRGQHGFGYDPIFIHTNHSVTFAEMDRLQKNTLSHRFKSLELIQILLRYL